LQIVFSKLKEKKAPKNNHGREREKASGKSEVELGNEEDESEDKEKDGGKKTDEKGVEEDKEMKY
jgi:hypothetical protein